MARKTIKKTASAESKLPAKRAAGDKEKLPVAIPEEAPAKPAAQFPIVGVGASAGGLQAFTEFLRCMPKDTGMGFVLVHHADPDHESLMADLLKSKTEMPVAFAADLQKVQPNHVYVIPPNTYLTIKDGMLHLSAPSDRRGARLPIDHFLKSLATDMRQNAIAVILTGTGSDGSAACSEIKENGGIVLVQDPAEALHDGMPRSAITTGSTDYIVPIAKMPEIIVHFGKHPFVKLGQAKKLLGENAQGSLPEIISTLKAYSPINFSLYKEGTMLRRIERRMILRHMVNSVDYLALLKDSPEEVEHLCQDLLISVTSFFRDPDAFGYLEKNVLHDLIVSHDPSRPFRVWVPGCATGEEAYSLGILLIEKISSLRKDVKLQVFASDVDERALGIARAGVYPESIEADLSAARLNRFFIKEDHSYRVIPELRETVVFASQNLLADAPFSKLDLVSCRNLLIYLTSEAQQRVMQMFHFALNDKGVLFLGSSETANNNEALFHPLSKKYRIYRRVGHGLRRPFEFPLQASRSAPIGQQASRVIATPVSNRLADISQRMLVDHYAPAAALINSNMETLYIHGPSDKYLKVPHGEVSRDLLAMARDGLRAQLGTAIRNARQTGAAVKTLGMLSRDGKSIPVEIHVHPTVVEGADLLLVTFADEPVSETEYPSQAVRKNVDHQLEQELETTRLDLRNTIRDFERSTEELKAANEEAMSMNEEFQSTNEELETSKEELQSLNEELTTLNTQLQQKIEEEHRVSDDLNNLLSSSGIATLFLDREFNIMRFTPTTRQFFNLISNDIGRPFSDITGKINDPTLLEDAATVLETLTPVELEVTTIEGKWFIRRVLPYRTMDGKIDGVVVTFSDVTSIKALQRESAIAKRFSESIVDTVREPLLVLDHDLRLVSVSESFKTMFKTGSTVLTGKSLFEIQGGQWDVPKLRDLLEHIVPLKSTIEAFDISLDVGKAGMRDMVLNARALRAEDGEKDQILLAVEDVTERNRIQQAIKDREARLSAILDAAPEAIITMSEKGIVTTYSPGAEDIFGYSANEVIGQNVKMLMPEPDHSKHDGYLKHYLETGEKKIIGVGREMDAKRKDGDRVPVRLTVSELRMGGERQFLGILHDMTLDVKRREELERARKMEAVGRLTGGLAHDFNNLLTVVIGNLELLQMRIEDKDKLELVSEALEASNLGAALTNQLLAFSKSQPLVPEKIELNELVKKVYPLLARSLGEEIEIKTNLAESLDLTVADAGQIESAILNMAINARDAMPKGGVLTLETRNVDLDSDYAATQVDVTPGKYVCLSVADTGTGLTPEVMAHAFEPFFTTKGPGKGYGLGLSMVYGFAKQSGGHVAIYSEIGLGTTISLYLPVVKVEAAQDTNAAQDDKAMPGDETILVVEDDIRVRRLTTTRLEQLGYKVHAASDGPAGLELLKEKKDIDLVLTDIVMPGGMSGFDVAEEARKLDPEMKVLLATGYAKNIDPTKREHEDLRILRKPYGLQELSKALRDLLD